MASRDLAWPNAPQKLAELGVFFIELRRRLVAEDPLEEFASVFVRRWTGDDTETSIWSGDPDELHTVIAQVDLGKAFTDHFPFREDLGLDLVPDKAFVPLIKLLNLAPVIANGFDDSADRRKCAETATAYLIASNLLEEGSQTPPRRGVSLRDVASLLTDGDRDAIRDTKRRWHNSRNPKLPESLGKCSTDSRAYLYALSAILNFVRKVEKRTGAEISAIEQPLRVKIRSVRDG